MFFFNEIAELFLKNSLKQNSLMLLNAELTIEVKSD